MKPKIMSKTLAAICGLMLTTCLGFSQGTAFTYQGRLNDGGNPATGLYDFRFAIYDSSNVPGNIIAGPVTNSAVGVNSCRGLNAT